jgi:hypothetical protein
LITQLIGLFKVLLDRYYKKKSITKLPTGGPAGVFFSKKGIPLEVYVDTIHDEEADIDFRIQYMCSCGLPVYRLVENEYGFGCLHCDSTCQVKDCDDCKYLYAADLGEEDADL